MVAKLAASGKKTGVRLEVVVDSVESALAAEKGGASRVELCAALGEGGLTPSAGMIAECRSALGIPVYVMIRPRGGDFLYSALEISVMHRDIREAKARGADGVVLGLLLPDGSVDTKRMASLLEEARPLDVTFHRAIDVCRDILEALDALIGLGVDRVLTSGQAATAMQGAGTIARMVRHARGRIGIIAGGRVNARNAAAIVHRTQVAELHARGARLVKGGMRYRHPNLTFRSAPLAHDHVNQYTDPGSIRGIVEAVT